VTISIFGIFGVTHSPDEIRTFNKGQIGPTKIYDTSIARIYLEPGKNV
jgi:hypothetical protein